MKGGFFTNRMGGQNKGFISSALDPDAVNYFNNAGITDATEKLAVNALFLRLKATPAIWTSISAGALYLISPTNVAASYINAVSSTDFIPSAVGVAPTYSTLGWDMGVNRAVKTGFIPSAQLASINTGVLGWYSNQDTTTTGYAMGALNSGTQRWEAVEYSAGNLQYRAMDSNNTLIPAIADTIGSYVCSNESSVLRHVIKDGVNIATDSNTITGALTTYEIYLGARNNAGTAQTFSVARKATFLLGPIGLSSANCIELSNAITEYNANVISGGRL